MTIKDILILPPLAFARLGSAGVPQPSYELAENPEDPLGFRRIVASKPFIVAADGTLLPDPTDYSDVNAIFRDGDRIRPVAPFFELYAIMEGKADPVPLTVERLKEASLDLSAIQWEAHVENRKVFRRTGDTKDIVKAETGPISDHVRHNLDGTCDNFGSKDDTVYFGGVQFIKPDDAKEVLRLRFTPARGRIYGTGKDIVNKPDYQSGGWKEFDQSKPGNLKDENTGEKWPRETLPSSLFAIKPPAPPWLNNNIAKSRGYFDDVCDGFILVHLKRPDREPLKAKARICVGPPSFIPDTLFIRTLADDLDQAANGPTAVDIASEDARKVTLDIVRRGFEAASFMNLNVLNGNVINGRAPEQFDSMPAEESFATDRMVRPAMSPAIMDTAAIKTLHRQIYTALSAGAAPWFSRLLRQPEEMGDLTDRGRRKMPALMSGADSYYLTLTRRQIATVEKAADPEITPRNGTANLLRDQLTYKAAGNPVNSRPEMVIANCCPGLEIDFRAVWRRLFAGIELCEWDNYIVQDTRARAEEADFRDHRLLSIVCWDGDEALPKRHPVVVELRGPSPSNPLGDVPVYSQNNPDGVWTMEWSNCLAHVVNAQRKHKAKSSDAFIVLCEFTAEPAETPKPLGTPSKWVWLRVRDFFEDETAVISEELAGPGELTQGLCSPWQNDLRECSCYYWASARPDFVNMTIGEDGLSHGDNWLAKERVGEYVVDDYADDRVMSYDDLFESWEKKLQFQIGGKDSAPDLLGPGAQPAPKPSKP